MTARRVLLALLAAAGLAAAAPTIAAADTQTATAGAVAATLSWTPGENEYSSVTDMRITVTRGGVLAYDAPVDPKGCEEATCTPSGTGEQSVTAADLDGDGEPEVVVDVFWGGAHCCTISRMLRWDGARYVPLDHNWGNTSYRLEDVDGNGRPELVSADDRFSYLYGSYAATVRPVQVFALQGGRLTDVTRSFPALVRADRAENYRIARRAGRFGRTAYAAWAADRYLLGERRAALRTLRRLARRGRLRTDLGANSRRAQRRWVSKLDRDLRKFGY
jgi:hypothetical protein